MGVVEHERVEIKVRIDLTLETNGSTCDLHNNDIAETPGHEFGINSGLIN